MAGRYPEIERYDQGVLEVGDGQLVDWEMWRSRPDAGDPGMTEATVAATDRFARRR